MFIQNYPDPDTAAYEATLAQAAKLFMRGKAPSARPLVLLVHAFKPIPPSWSNRDRDLALAGGILPTSRPDGDNYLKIVDALNGIVWIDDAQVVDGRVIKRYSARPALRIEVREFVDP
jgi:Holliday junction resolvase RusA-like endonuclease